MNIEGNLIAIHMIPGRPDIAIVVVSAGTMGGQFTCKTSHVLCDWKKITRVGELADYIAGRSYVAAKLVNVDNSMHVGNIRECESIELVTSETPIQDLG